jgi:transposase InsO family protein
MLAMAMREDGNPAKSHRKFRVTVADSRITLSRLQNVLDREFTAETRNQKWMSDITDIATLEEWLYLAAVIDLFTRKGGGLVDVGADR